MEETNKLLETKKLEFLENLKQLHNEHLLNSAFIFAKNNLENVYGDCINGKSLDKVLKHLKNQKGDYNYMVENFTVSEQQTISFISHKIMQLL